MRTEASITSWKFFLKLLCSALACLQCFISFLWCCKIFASYCLQYETDLLSGLSGSRIVCHGHFRRILVRRLRFHRVQYCMDLHSIHCPETSGHAILSRTVVNDLEFCAVFLKSVDVFQSGLKGMSCNRHNGLSYIYTSWYTCLELDALL